MAGSDTFNEPKKRLRIVENPPTLGDGYFAWAVRGRVFSFEQNELPDEGYKFKIKTFHIEARCVEDAIDAVRFHVGRNLKLKGFFPLSVKCENLPLK